MIMDLVKEFIADVIGACLGVVVDWMSLFLLKTNDTSIYPRLDTMILIGQGVGIALAGVFLIQRCMRAILTPGESLADILYSVFISAIWIAFMPMYLEILLWFCDQGIQLFKDLGIDARGMVDTLLSKYAGNGITNVAVGTLILILFISIGWFCLVFAAAKVAAEIYGSFVLGSIFGATQVNRAEIFQAFNAKVISVIFSKVWWVFLIWSTTQFIAMGTTLSLCLGVGSTWLAVTGPAFLSQFLYKTGVADAATGLGRFALFKLFARNIPK